MCCTVQWAVSQMQSYRRPVPGEFFRLPVRWVIASRPAGWSARAAVSAG